MLLLIFLKEVRIMTDVVWLYVEVNLICALVTGIILVKSVGSVDKRRLPRLFCVITSFFILTFITDALWFSVSETKTDIGTAGCYIINEFFFVSASLGSFFWYLYIEYFQDSKICKSRKYEFLTAIPMLGLIMLIITTSFTGFIFFIDNEGGYHRGPLHIIHTILVYAYPFFASVKLLIKAYMKEFYHKKKNYISVALVIIVPSLFTVIQIAMGGRLPFQCIGYTVSILLVYTQQQESKITVDALTQLKTRDEVIRHLSHRMSQRFGNKKLYLYMIDADKFKGINDKYGHVEGDEALKLIANALKASFPKDYVIGRFGGDEFIAVGDAENNEEAGTYCENVRKKLVETSAEKPYKLSVSIGYAQRRENITNIPDFIKLADTKLYAIKESRSA